MLLSVVCLRTRCLLATTAIVAVNYRQKSHIVAPLVRSSITAHTFNLALNSLKAPEPPHLDIFNTMQAPHHTKPRHTTSKNKTRRDLLQLVDHTRDETLPSLGVHVHDELDNECTWMVLPPERRRGRKERLEEREQQVGESCTEAAVEAATAGAGARAKESAEPGDATWADDEEEKRQPRVGDAGRRKE